MTFLRNPEIRRSLLLWIAATVVLILLAALWSPAAAAGAAAAGILLGIFHFVETRRRYSRLAGLSREIDRVLHGAARDQLDRYREGELAILHNELSKMTIRLQQQAEALSRDKRFLSDSMADLSHQLRTPLTSLRLVASMLSDGEISEDRRLELLRELHSLLGRLDWLIETMLKLSRLDAGTVQLASEPVDAARLVRDSAAALAVPMDLRDLRLRIDVEEGASFVGDFAWSEEALGNVLKNCMEHTPPGGEIRVEVRTTPIFTEFTVEDTGPGIDPEDLPHLFERFYKGHDASPASVGIGLALAQQIVARQNGTIRAANGLHGGARFTIRFYSETV